MVDGAVAPPRDGADAAGRMREFYDSSELYHYLLGDEEPGKDRSFRLYTLLVEREGQPRDLVLDLGCGRGITTLALRSGGRKAIGADLSLSLLRDARAQDPLLPLVVASADRLPFRDGSFGAVGLNNVVEHLTDVPAALAEVKRVLSQGASAVVVSPNLLTPLRPLRAFLGLGKRYVSLGFHGGRLGSLGAVFGNAWRIGARQLSRAPRFLYREPQLDDFVEPDDDATFLCNHLDLMHWFRQSGMEVRRVPPPLGPRTRMQRLRDAVAWVLPWLDKGFCLVADKPE